MLMIRMHSFCIIESSCSTWPAEQLHIHVCVCVHQLEAWLPNCVVALAGYVSGWSPTYLVCNGLVDLGQFYVWAAVQLCNGAC